MSILKTLVKKTKIYNLIPEGHLKKKLRCFVYNLPMSVNSKELIAKTNGKYYDIEFDGVEFKYEGGYQHFKSFMEGGEVRGYTQEYELKKGDIVVDAGAYPGDFTIFAAKKVGKEGTVIAFEPDDVNFERLQENIQLNNLDNVVLVKKGLWGDNKIIEFDTKSDGSSSISLEDNTASKLLKIPVVRLDDELSKLGISQLDFIKMDIEGAEIGAIKGCETILKENNVNLAIASYHIVNGKKTCYKLEKLLSKMGYTAHTSFPQHLTTYARKSRKT